MSDITLWEIQSLFALHISVSSPSGFLFTHIHTSDCCPSVLGSSVPFFPFAFQFWKFLLTYPQAQRSFSAVFSPPVSLSKAFFNSVTVFRSLAFLLESFSEFLPFCLHCPFVLTCHLLFPLKSLAYLIVLLNSQAVESNNSALSAYDVCPVSFSYHICFVSSPFHLATFFVERQRWYTRSKELQ